MWWIEKRNGNENGKKKSKKRSLTKTFHGITTENESRAILPKVEINNVPSWEKVVATPRKPQSSIIF